MNICNICSCYKAHYSPSPVNSLYPPLKKMGSDQVVGYPVRHTVGLIYMVEGYTGGDWG